jgi:hypothetical protein
MDAALGIKATVVGLQPLIAILMQPLAKGIVKESGSQTHRHHPLVGMGAALGMEATVAEIQLLIAIRVNRSVKEIVKANGKAGKDKLICGTGIIPFCLQCRVFGLTIFLEKLCLSKIGRSD